MARAEVRKQDLASEIAAIVGSSSMDASRVNGKTADASETAVMWCVAVRCDGDATDAHFSGWATNDHTIA